MPQGYRNAVGDTPQTIVNIERETVDWKVMTRINCGKPHGLTAGDQVRIHITWADSEITKDLLEGNWAVVETGKTGLGTRNDDWFVITPKFKHGMRVVGTWQLASSYVPVNQPPVVIGGNIPGNATPITPEATDQAKTSKIVWYIAGGLAVLAIGIFAYNKFAHKGH